VSDIHTLIGVSHPMFLNVGFCHSRLEKKAKHAGTRARASLYHEICGQLMCPCQEGSV